MPAPIVFALAVVAVIVAASAVGAALRTRLPDHHLRDETKDMVKIAVGLLATLASLVLGLLLGTAKGTFDGLSHEIQDAAVSVTVLDDDLRDMGPAGAPLRAQLERQVSGRLDALWAHGSAVPPGTLLDMRRALRDAPVTDDDQRRARDKALLELDTLHRIRLLTQTPATSAITVPLLGLIVFWFAVIAVGLNVFAPRNGTIAAVNVLAALSVAGATYLILEMEQPYSGLIRVSAEPLQAALAALRATK